MDPTIDNDPPPSYPDVPPLDYQMHHFYDDAPPAYVEDTFIPTLPPSFEQVYPSSRRQRLGHYCVRNCPSHWCKDIAPKNHYEKAIWGCGFTAGCWFGAAAFSVVALNVTLGVPPEDEDKDSMTNMFLGASVGTALAGLGTFACCGYQYYKHKHQ